MNKYQICNFWNKSVNYTALHSTAPICIKYVAILIAQEEWEPSKEGSLYCPSFFYQVSKTLHSLSSAWCFVPWIGRISQNLAFSFGIPWQEYFCVLISVSQSWMKCTFIFGVSFRSWNPLCRHISHASSVIHYSQVMWAIQSCSYISAIFMSSLPSLPCIAG